MDFPNIPSADLVESLGIDYETNILEYWLPEFQVLGVAIATCDAEWYFDIRENPRVVDWLRDLIAGRELIAQNAQFDYQCTRALHIDPRKSKWYCTMVTECLINEHHLKYDLASICTYNNIDSQKKRHLDALAEAMGVGTHREVLSRLTEAPPALVAAYGASDARDAYDLKAPQMKALYTQDLLRVHELEMDLLPVLADMSWHGIRVDLEAAHAAIPVLDEKIDTIQKEIDIIAGRKFNVNSTPQIREFFNPKQINKFQYELVDGTIVGPTKTGGGPSIDQNALREIKHPMAAKILALRKNIKLRDTFIRGHVIGSADPDGYVHTHFNQTRNDADAGTVTGRLSSTDPALQQITKRDKDNAAILRAMFLADAGQQWLCCDYSQVDFRCAAHLQNDPAVIAAYAEDPSLDYHQVVSDMTGIPRNPPYAGAPNTKQINLGLSFGAGQGKLAFMMGMPYTLKEYRGKMMYVGGEESEKIFDLYHKKLPSTKAFMKKAESIAKETHYVRTQLGRRLRFPRGIGAHKAAGLLYQAYAADLHKIGLVETDRYIRENRIPARLMMSCHDEIGVSSDVDEDVKQGVMIRYTDFQSPHSRVNMRVPITASAEFGVNWWLASK